METQAVDMTTSLNVEMLKELRSTLEALNKQQLMESLSIAKPDPEEREMIATRKLATRAVMRAIKAFCSPLMVCPHAGNQRDEALKELKRAEERIHELKQDRDIIHQDAERWREVAAYWKNRHEMDNAPAAIENS